MRHIVITGSTRGIGYGLAEAFLARGCCVTVSGRSQPGVDAAVERLAATFQPDRIFGQACDVAQPAQVQSLWDQASARFGQVDIWINNAGMSNPQKPLWQQTAETTQAVVATNLLGTIHGAQVAIRGMLGQGFGSVYLMEGLGSNGSRVDGLALYGATKYAVRYLCESLARETRATPLVVGALSPGMVVTDLLTGDYAGRPAEWRRARRIFNILADRVETVTPWLAEQVLANTRSGRHIAWLTRGKIIRRFLAAPLRRRDLFT
jgi:NAD(P)-dependent dehydrogenase (short-subunit alcohol dehydrogenase family)